MLHEMLKSKIHRATVTAADLDYEGSVTIDATLMAAAEILPYEAIHVWNVTNGERLQTYAIEGEADSGVICINGAAAHRVRERDLVILSTFASMDTEAARSHQPKVVLVDADNRIREITTAEIAGPAFAHRPNSG